ncbi:MAG: hypothetical protein LBO82_03535 [Synergistaceae bacterium]|nr:hypothetical protein [Synergistaceae bacterium]
MNAQNSEALAPIAFFAYRRPEHTKRTLEALAANALASESDLFIFSDGPRNEQAKEGVRAVREYIRTVKGFKSVTIREHEQNRGLAKSLISGITELCDRFGRVVVVEDDVLTSPYFLQFMHDGLEKYEDNEKVFSIGACWPLKPELGDNAAFFLNSFSVWGWATWKRAWDFYDYHAAGWEELLKNKRLAWDFDLEGKADATALLLSQVKDNIDTWDIQWGWVIYREKKLSLFPPYSLTKNIGFDSLGEHTTSPAGEYSMRNIDLSINNAITFPTQVELHQEKRAALGDFCYSDVKRRRGMSLRGLFWTFYRPLRRILLPVPYGITLRHNFRL